ncbi:hypothetical protein HYW94_00470 [Candidatus Uhrbacteria bacterium]|nr:hypothetical protein [Candidatus Uhrbacteria bacterium]
MIKNKKYFLNISAIVAIFLLSFSYQAHAAVETGLSATANTAGYNTATSIQTFIGYGIQAILGVVGAVFFGILVYGGILWMFSDGDQNKITKARGMIFYAIAGILVVLGAYAITSFITTEIAQKALKE